jgi:hypothetical protein
MSGEITALLRKTPGGGIEARGYNDQWQTVPRDAVAEIQRLTEENERLREALENVMGHIDTPIGRRKLNIKTEQPEWLVSARAALKGGE